MESNETKLNRERYRAFSQAKIVLSLIKPLEEELKGLREEYKDYKEQYKKADYALAQVDGRLERVKVGKSGKVTQLTMKQIKNVAKKLGVKL